MLKNPEETEPLLPENPEDAGSSEDTKRTAQEKHEMFKKEIEGAQTSLESAEGHQQATLDQMQQSKGVFTRVSMKLVELDEELEKNDSLLASLMRKAICNKICLWIIIVCLVIGNLLVLFFLYIHPSNGQGAAKGGAGAPSAGSKAGA